MQRNNPQQNINPDKAQTDTNEYESVAKTITHRESEFPLILNKNFGTQLQDFKNSASIIDLEVLPRDKSLKQQDKQNIALKMKEFLLERIRIYVYPSGNDKLYVGFKLYNIDLPIKFKGEPLISDFKSVYQTIDKQQSIKESSRVVAELGYELIFLPYNIQNKYDNLKNECFFSFYYECSTAITTITVLVVRIADNNQICIISHK